MEQKLIASEVTVQQGNKINENKITNRQIKRSNEVGSQYYRKTKVAINKRKKLWKELQQVS